MAPRDQREVSSDEDSAPAGDLRRGPWTVEEDLLLVNYIAAHGEGRWNALARCAGIHLIHALIDPSIVPRQHQKHSIKMKLN
jgi:hypothetical protein